MKTDLHESFLKLVRLGIGTSSDVSFQESKEWKVLKTIALEQGLLGVMMDGIEHLPLERRPAKKDLLQWIGLVIQEEQKYAVRDKVAKEVALLLHAKGIRTYVLKGTIVAECYPKPEHRVSSDMDCFLVSESGEHEQTWEKGNVAMEEAGFDVERGFYKNSSFYLPGLMVENHLYMVPFRGNKRLAELERLLESWIQKDEEVNKIEGTMLYRPPVMASALFLIEHAYSHFLHEGLTWRHILDWMMFSQRHQEEINWEVLDAGIDEFGGRKFYNSYYRLGKYLVGELSADDLQFVDKLMMKDVWAPLDLHKTLQGVKGKLALVGNTWRARWKYHYFAEINWLQALWIQAYGVLFDKHPKLD
ncbi:MAG: nucleotidyltransferase family protein [Bacteroidales bacterium]|nr:nucleotidyltransferase family protein [Bacteroidales bacterium]